MSEQTGLHDLVDRITGFDLVLIRATSKTSCAMLFVLALMIPNATGCL